MIIVLVLMITWVMAVGVTKIVLLGKITAVKRSAIRVMVTKGTVVLASVSSASDTISLVMITLVSAVVMMIKVTIEVTVTVITVVSWAFLVFLVMMIASVTVV